MSSPHHNFDYRKVEIHKYIDKQIQIHKYTSKVCPTMETITSLIAKQLKSGNVMSQQVYKTLLRAQTI